MARQSAGAPRRRAIAIASSSGDEAGLFARRERDRAYRSAHAEVIAAKARIWREANKDHIREARRRWKEANRERSRELNRESMRRAAARRRRLADIRHKARERSAQWKRQHPEHVREYKKRWVEDNRDKVREYYRRYHATHRDEVNARAAARRDADPEKAKRARKQWADRNKDRLAELQREYRRDPEKYRAVLDANSAAKRLARRLERAGLPPKRVHRSTAADRRANDRAAEGYFVSPDTSERVRQVTEFTEALTAHVLKNGARMREFAEAYVVTRERMGLPTMDAEKVVYARAVEFVTDRMRRVDHVTSRDVAAAVRSAKATYADHERRQQYVALGEAVKAYLRRHHAGLSARAVAVNRARVQAGQPRTPVGMTIARIAIAEASRQVPVDRLRAGDLRSLGDHALGWSELLIASAYDPATCTAARSRSHVQRL
ncbi:hypothetical protein [Microbacterium sp. 2FI]|uniref:hypothetical protein n=1 Tax=Microbacterium sp. 2FI TaxID=2502193 RepID=UPI0010F94444|nr:hypothetical protein [Microbacterium sp. 2FI]